MGHSHAAVFDIGKEKGALEALYCFLDEAGFARRYVFGRYLDSDQTTVELYFHNTDDAVWAGSIWPAPDQIDPIGAPRGTLLLKPVGLSVAANEQDES